MTQTTNDDSTISTIKLPDGVRRKLLEHEASITRPVKTIKRGEAQVRTPDGQHVGWALHPGRRWWGVTADGETILGPFNSRRVAAEAILEAVSPRSRRHPRVA